VTDQEEMTCFRACGCVRAHQVLNRFGTFSDHEWEIAHLYLVIVLEKMPEGYNVRTFANCSVAPVSP
jgi:hypothetical protein